MHMETEHQTHSHQQPDHLVGVLLLWCSKRRHGVLFMCWRIVQDKSKTTKIVAIFPEEP